MQSPADLRWAQWLDFDFREWIAKKLKSSINWWVWAWLRISHRYLWSATWFSFWASHNRRKLWGVAPFSYSIASNIFRSSLENSLLYRDSANLPSFDAGERLLTFRMASVLLVILYVSPILWKFQVSHAVDFGHMIKMWPKPSTVF